MKIYFAELKKLKPTMVSTILKMNEEIGELNREVLRFLPYKDCSRKVISTIPEANEALQDLIGELLDVGQTTATMFFTLNPSKELANKAISLHLAKLRKKGYSYNQEEEYSLVEESGEMHLVLPELLINTNLLQTCLKIGEEAGELSQLVGKKQKMSGENNNYEFSPEDLNSALLGGLLDVAQCCVTMLYILVDKYNIDVTNILEKHISKLRVRGYC